jgi:hypothetical protein
LTLDGRVASAARKSTKVFFLASERRSGDFSKEIGAIVLSRAKLNPCYHENMYKTDLTRQSLTDDEYLILLGICQWVFNSNCSFIIEMIDSEHHENSDTSWFEFLGLTAGQLKNHKGLLLSLLGKDIYKLFENLAVHRNMIIHSSPTGEKRENYYVPMYRKTKQDDYIVIDKEFLKNFIQDNEQLSLLIHKVRDS